jgi:hypothetical protein
MELSVGHASDRLPLCQALPAPILNQRSPQVDTRGFIPSICFHSLNLAPYSPRIPSPPGKVDVTTAPHLWIHKCPLSRVQALTPNTALPRMSINASLIVVALSPEDAKTLSALPTMVPARCSCRCCSFGNAPQSLPGHPEARLPPTPALIPPVSSATPM